MSPAEQWAARYQAGFTLREIAAEAGVSFVTVRKYIRELGVEMRPPVTRRGRVAWHGQAVQLWVSGMTQTAIARQFGVTQPTVHRMLRRAGL